MQPYSLDQMSKNTREKGNWWHTPSFLGEISIKLDDHIKITEEKRNQES